MTKRVVELRKLLFTGSHKQYRVESLQTSILNGKTEKLPFAVRKAMSFKKMCELAPIFIQPGELIVGGKTVYTLPQYITEEEMRCGTGHLEIDKDYNYLFGYIYNLCQDERGYGTANSDAPCYYRLLPLGFPKLVEEIKDKRDKEVDLDKINFYDSALISLEGVLVLIKRYEILVEEEYKREKSDERKEELKKLKNVLKNIQENSPQDFWEAVQFVYFIQFSLWMEGGYLIPLGRMDQYLYPFYKEALRTKKYSHEYMYELLECMFIKLNYEIDKTHGGDDGRFNSDTGQTVTIGGIDPRTGEDVSNELTLSLMDIKIDLHITDPRIHLRIHKNTPEIVWKKAAELTAAGMGYPTYDNDEAIIKALVRKHGYREEDARDYCASGCWEIIIQGKSSNTNLGDIDCLRILEWALNDGKNVLSIAPDAIGLVEGRWGLRTGKEESLQNFGQLMTAFKAQMKHNIDRVACNCNAGRMSPSPLYSACMEDCIEKGQDIADGGCRYYETDFQLSSLSNAADSLYAIKKLVYEDKRYTLKEFNTILKNNYEGNEALRQEIINKFPKFGNDDERVDDIAGEIVSYFVQEVTKHTNLYGGPYRARIASALGYVSIAKQLGASADGRKHRDFYAADLSPGLGAERSGPTGVIKSCRKIPSGGLAGGEILDMRFNPSALKSEKNRDKFIALIKSYFQLGGLQIQVDVQDKKVLTDAKKHPENYPDLLVRVWGFSAYFVSLPEDYQDQLIARTEMGF